MNLVNLLIAYINHSSIITIVVLGWLSIYFIITLAIFISRYISLSFWKGRESTSLNKMLMGAKTVRNDSALNAYSRSRSHEINLLQVCKNKAEQNASIGFAWLSIIASTSPFIGLFGTVVSILETFASLGDSSANIAMIAPAISEALVATASGILVAIPAYTFHAILKRKAFSVINLIDQQIIILENFKKRVESAQS